MLIRQRLWGFLIWALAVTFVVGAGGHSVDLSPGLRAGSPLADYDPPSAIFDQDPPAVLASFKKASATAELILLVAITTALFGALRMVCVRLPANNEGAADHPIGVRRKTGPPPATGAPA